jgi:RimJ/RimL family protein N-acetyltransferase
MTITTNFDEFVGRYNNPDNVYQPENPRGQVEDFTDPMFDLLFNMNKSKLSSDEHLIYEMVEEYNWEYKNHVKSELILNYINVGIMDRENNIIKKYCKVIRNKEKQVVGFYIFNKYNKIKGELGYMFIKPEHRRRNYATIIIKRLQNKYSDISCDTKDTPFIRIIKRLGFKFIRRCDNNVEDNYMWKK